jgi:serine/threonine-protein kinase
MYNATYNPEVVVDDRYLPRRTIDDKRMGMIAVVGFDQQAEREVFIKSRDPEADNNAAMRISREADVLASLDHPQIPALIDADPDADRPYIVTELIDHYPKVTEGFTHNPNPIFAAELCVAALAPLEHAHDAGFTHRDIKPTNLLMTWGGDVALSDWEIALCKDRQLASATYTDTCYDDWRVTAFGKAWGSEGYMSPEQAEGRYKIQDGRSDLYSIGVMLYLFLHGKLPRPSKGSNEQVINEVLMDDITHSYSPGRSVPDALSEVAERALQQEPSDRYQSAAEMSEDMERYLRSPAYNLLTAA